MPIKQYFRFFLKLVVKFPFHNYLSTHPDFVVVAYLKNAKENPSDSFAL